MILQSLTRFRDFGLLLMRCGLGAVFMMHGWPKMTGGPDKWKMLGKAMANVGIDVFPLFWGFMAMFSELAGGVLLILGLFFRPATILMAITMAVATATKIAGAKGDWFSEAAHPLSLTIVFFGLIFVGPGRFSIDKN